MAAKKSKRVDPIKQRERRAKIAAGVGGVLFLLLAAYEVPNVMKLMNQKPPPGSQFSDAVKTNPDGSVPLPSVATAAVNPDGSLADSDVPPSTGAGQLVSFSMFQTKNPFIPQVTVSEQGPSSSSSSSSTGATTTTPTNADKPGADVPGTGLTTTTTTTPGSIVPSSGTSTTSTSTTTTAAPAPQVAISVNGTVSRVATNDTFPTDAPVFRLISYGSGTAQIGIVGGSYADGNQTLSLQQGKPITLENQTTGTKYKVELLSTP